jgi:hypothetical protein
VFTVLAIASGAVPDEETEAASPSTSVPDTDQETPESTSPDNGAEAVAAPDTAPIDYSSDTWKADLLSIAASEDSAIALTDEATRLGRRLTMSDAAANAELSSMIEHVQSGTLLSRPTTDEAWALNQIATATAIEAHFDQASPQAAFAFDYFQVIRDLYRGTEEPGSDFIQANLDQLNRAIDDGL